MSRAFNVRSFIARYIGGGRPLVSELPGWSTHCKAVPHGVLGHHARLAELSEVVGATRLGPHPGAAVAAEGLATDHRTRGAAVDVQVADRRAANHLRHSGRVAREQT